MTRMRAIRLARCDELHLLREIELDAGGLFVAVGMPEIAAHEPLTISELEAYQRCGRAWVAVDGGDRPVGYLISSELDGGAHIDQVSVATAHARRRLGAALIEHLATIAAADGRPALTLTAFRDVTWNAPYYARLGFVVIEPADQGPELRALIAHESVAIPGSAPRVAMRRHI
jgi:GNAT superfamily N-acetyltransferase